MVIMLVVGFSSAALGEDVFGFAGRTLTDVEMADTRGGLSFSDGSFITFNMDFLKFNFINSNEPGGEEVSGFVNAISQHAVINDEGIQLDIDALQAGNMIPGLEPGQINQVGQIDNISLVDSFNNFTGWANTNLIAGNGNIATISNVIKIDIGFYGVSDFDPLRTLGLVLR